MLADDKRQQTIYSYQPSQTSQTNQKMLFVSNFVKKQTIINGRSVNFYNYQYIYTGQVNSCQ